ncbi:AIPR family protein [Priestia megaterium]|uniref:AIPR family protein n=1 Tax=Priestia megaterium TaxID=1404 RepID=UPI003F7E6A2E
MHEKQQKIEFFNEFMEGVEKRGVAMGSRQTPFLEAVLPYISEEDEPNVLYFGSSSAKVQLNGYLYSEENNSLNLYVVDYDIEYEDERLPEITKTAVTEVATKAKRFFTNAKAFHAHAERTLEVANLAKHILDIQNELEEVNIYVVTNRFYTSNKPIDLTIPGIPNVNVYVWDMDRVFKLTEAEQGIKDFEIDLGKYGTYFEMMKVPEQSNEEGQYSIDCYIGYIPASLLAQLYNEFGPKLVERNVRSFLQARGGTNKGIRDTLKKSQQRNLFVAYNNGISSVAKSGDIEQIGDSNVYRIKSLTGWQIVNGGQTTASIHQAFKNEVPLEEVFVQAKLTIIHVDTENEADRYLLEDEMISKISEYANTQNKINKSDLLANTRFMSDIEKYSRSTWIPSQDGRKEESKWYFERARGQYMVDIGRRKKGKEQNEFKKTYPKELVLTKVELAKYFMSWKGHPHVSSKGGEVAFTKFMGLNSQYWKHDATEGNKVESINELFYTNLIACCIINNYVKSVVEQMNLKGYKANVIYYTVSMLNHLYSNQIDLEYVWKKQQLSSEWERCIQTIAKAALDHLRSSAGERNVTQWAKNEECWELFKEQYSKPLNNLI